jgi:hypothetical protein
LACPFLDDAVDDLDHDADTISMMMLITISITMLIIMLSLDRCRGLFAPAGFAPAFLRLNLSNDLLDLGQCRRDPVTPQIALDQDG